MYSKSVSTYCTVLSGGKSIRKDKAVESENAHLEHMWRHDDCSDFSYWIFFSQDTLKWLTSSSSSSGNTIPRIVFTQLFLCSAFFCEWFLNWSLNLAGRFLMPWFHPGALLAFSAKWEINQRNWSEVQNMILYAKMLIYTVNSQIPCHFLELT